MSEVRWCSECDHVHPASRDAEKPWNWRCLKYPRPSGYGFVHPSYSPAPPFKRCLDQNYDGACPSFEPMRRPASEAC